MSLSSFLFLYYIYLASSLERPVFWWNSFLMFVQKLISRITIIMSLPACFKDILLRGVGEHLLDSSFALCLMSHFPIGKLWQIKCRYLSPGKFKSWQNLLLFSKRFICQYLKRYQNHHDTIIYRNLTTFLLESMHAV